MRFRAFESSLAAMFAALTAVGAYICIPLPFTPVPVTLQSFFTYLAILLLGGKLAALSQVLYLMLGIMGLPVFAGGKMGFGVLMGPTGGYLIGFIFGAYAGGKIAERGLSFTRCMVALIVATVLIYGFGVIQLWFSMNFLYGEGLGFSFSEALLIGVIPFLPGDLAKILIAISLLRSRYFTALRGKILFEQERERP